ncbi:MAG: IPT/TIG domain-containing protein, partial [Phycisphaerae bacterium]
TPDVYFLNPNSNVGSIIGGSSATGFVGAGVYQASPTDPAFQTNASAYPDHMIMFGRFTLKCSDIVASGGPVKMTMWCDFVGKSTAQTGGTTLYTIASANVKSDAQTKYTTSAKVWTFDPGFEGVVAGQALWTFAASANPEIAVADLTASNNLSDRVQLTWTPLAGATGYSVWRAQASDPYSNIGIVATNTGSYADTTAVVGTVYSYKVQATGGTLFSNIVTGSIPGAPTITTVSPTSGSAGGGTLITITGTNFIAGATVTVGGAAATSVVVVSATSITAQTPAGTTGAQDVTVTTGGGNVTAPGAFTYIILAPTIASVSPTSGSTLGGTVITITGANLTNASAVTVGGNPATSVVVVDSTHVTAVTPAGAAGSAQPVT